MKDFETGTGVVFSALRAAAEKSYPLDVSRERPALIRVLLQAGVSIEPDLRDNEHIKVIFNSLRCEAAGGCAVVVVSL